MFRIYHNSLYPYILSLVKSENDALEIVQESMLKLWQLRASLPDIHNPLAWLRTLTANVAFDYLRAQARYQYVLSKLADETEMWQEDAWDKYGLQDVRKIIHEAVELLPLRRREIFRMSKIQGFSRREIALELQISENTVRNQLAEAMDFVVQYLQKHRNVLLCMILTACFCRYILNMNNSTSSFREESLNIVQRSDRA